MGNSSNEDTGPESTRDVIASQVVNAISNRSFQTWFHEREVEQNILEGRHYFNGASPPKQPEQHSPSNLLQCQRKKWYDRLNAPKEDTRPEGLFLFGNTFEEDVIVPYLQDTATTDETYIQNSIWIDSEIDVDDTTLHVKGATDPAIVTADADPLFVTEVKTTSSIERLSAPKDHHRAQLHAYLYALDEQYDHAVREGMILYADRKTLTIKPFHVTFDSAFWNRVVEWMRTQTEFQMTGELPPASPERSWECSYCSFKHRCGESDAPFSDVRAGGLLPLVDAYDRQPLEEYLEAHCPCLYCLSLSYRFSSF